MRLEKIVQGASITLVMLGGGFTDAYEYFITRLYNYHNIYRIHSSLSTKITVYLLFK